MKTVYACLFAALTLVGAYAGTDTKDAKEMAVEPQSKKLSGILFAGIDGRGSAWYSYAGTVYALNHDIDSSGWLLRGLVGGGEYNYTTSSFNGKVRGALFDNKVGIGYKFAQQDWSITGAVGPHFRDKMMNVELPGDGSNTRVGAVFNLDFNATTGPVLWNALTEYSTIENSSWDRLRVGYQIEGAPLGITVGPEFTFNHDHNFFEYRGGAFVSFKVTDDVSFSVSTGYAKYAVEVAGNNHSDSVYGDFGLTYSY